MPIYEFKCLKCNQFFELLVMTQKEALSMRCPHCQSEDFERMLSVASHVSVGGTGGAKGVETQTRTCSSGSCTTYNIPGPK